MKAFKAFKSWTPARCYFTIARRQAAARATSCIKTIPKPYAIATEKTNKSSFLPASPLPETGKNSTPKSCQVAYIRPTRTLPKSSLFESPCILLHTYPFMHATPLCTPMQLSTQLLLKPYPHANPFPSPYHPSRSFRYFDSFSEQ